MNQEHTSTLKSAIKNQHTAKHLSPQQLQQLMALQQQYAPQTDQKRLSPLIKSFFTLAASILLIILLFSPHSWTDKSSKNLIHQKIAHEVVKNHLHLKPLEVNTQNIVDIQAYFKQLTFRPIESQLVKQLFPNQLLGARYCSIQGITAAQLRFKNTQKDVIHTLYQVAYHPKIFQYIPNIDQNQTPISVYSQGIKVTLWQEKGLLFALTRDE